MANTILQLQQLAEVLHDASEEIRLARKQCPEVTTLKVRVWRASVKAARAVMTAVTVEGFDHWSVLSHLSHSERGDVISDGEAIGLWTSFICPIIRSEDGAGNGAAGFYDIAPVKTDAEGRILGRDGERLKYVEKGDPDTGQVTGWHVDGPEARVTDDFNEYQLLEWERCRASDWADICRLAGRIIQAHLESPSQQKAEKSVEKRKRKNARPNGKTELQELIIAGLCVHHKYNSDAPMHLNPIASVKLATSVKCATSTVSQFFKVNYRGYKNYCRQCTNEEVLRTSLALLRGDLSPHRLSQMPADVTDPRSLKDSTFDSSTPDTEL